MTSRLMSFSRDSTQAFERVAEVVGRSPSATIPSLLTIRIQRRLWPIFQDHCCSACPLSSVWTPLSRELRQNASELVRRLEEGEEIVYHRRRQTRCQASFRPRWANVVRAKPRRFVGIVAAYRSQSTGPAAASVLIPWCSSCDVASSAYPSGVGIGGGCRIPMRV